MALEMLKGTVTGIVKLTRMPYDSYVLITFPDGSSEDVEGERLVPYLTAIGVKNPDNIADKVWNFYNATVKL